MNIKPIWLKYGLYYFGISFVLFLIGIYVGNIGAMLNFIIGLAILIIFLRMMFAELSAEKGNAFYTYGEAFLPIFLAVFVGYFLQNLLSAVWVNFIDPSSKEVLLAQAMDAAKGMAGMFGAEASEAANEAIEAQSEAMEANFEFGKMMIGSWVVPIGAAFVGAIAALFFRKEEKFKDVL